MIDKIRPVFHAAYIQFGGHAVSRIHAHSFQPGQLLQEAAVFPEVHYTVQFHVVAASAEHAMPVDYLFAADKVFGTAQVDEPVQQVKAAQHGSP